MTARTAPTSATSSSATRISDTTPATGEGISVSTLSVLTSSSGSSTATVSPTCFSHRVTVPSVTLSPRAGSLTSVPAWALAGAEVVGEEPEGESGRVAAVWAGAESWGVACANPGKDGPVKVGPVKVGPVNAGPEVEGAGRAGVVGAVPAGGAGVAGCAPDGGGGKDPSGLPVGGAGNPDPAGAGGEDGAVGTGANPGAANPGAAGRGSAGA